MGALTKTVRSIVPQAKAAVVEMVPTWQQGNPQVAQASYEVFAREGYTKNGIVFACIDEIATSAADPKLVGVRRNGEDEELIRDHDLVRLIDRPNPFMSQFDLWSNVMMHLSVAGNAYVLKERSAAGKVVELWLLRPDWVRVIPDRKRFVGGYQYVVPGLDPQFIPPEDVIHIKNRHPLDQFYGMPPLLPIASWVDIDSWMGNFVKAFFQNAGVPAGILTTNRRLGEDEKRELREKWRADFSGPGGWNKIAVFDGQGGTGGAETSYTPMGLPLGGRGLVVPELEEIASTRIVMAFRVPAEIIGVRLTMMHRGLSKGAMQDALNGFWLQTLTPIYKRLADAMAMGLLPEFGGLDGLRFDLSQVAALQEDQDALHTRIRADFGASLMSFEESRARLSLPPDATPTDIFAVNFNITPTLGSELAVPKAAPTVPNEPPAKRRKVAV